MGGVECEVVSLPGTPVTLTGKEVGHYLPDGTSWVRLAQTFFSTLCMYGPLLHICSTLSTPSHSFHHTYFLTPSHTPHTHPLTLTPSHSPPHIPLTLTPSHSPPYTESLTFTPLLSHTHIHPLTLTSLHSHQYRSESKCTTTTLHFMGQISYILN